MKLVSKALVLASLCLWTAAPLTAQGPSAEPPTEKELIAGFNKAFKASSPEQRSTAVSAFSGATRQLEDGGTSKAVAKALARALDDDDLSVTAAAVNALAWGRNVEVVIPAFDEVLHELRKGIEKRLTRPDDESRQYRSNATSLYAASCRALGRHGDDRAVEALASQLKNLQRNKKGGQNLSTLLVKPLSDALLELGTRDAVEIVVKQTSTYAGVHQKAPAKRIHQSLATFSDSVLGYAPPAFGDQFDQDWRAWFDQHEDALAKKLGKLTDPPGEPAYEKREMRGMDREDPGAPKRP